MLMEGGDIGKLLDPSDISNAIDNTESEIEDSINNLDSILNTGLVNTGDSKITKKLN